MLAATIVGGGGDVIMGAIAGVALVLLGWLAGENTRAGRIYAAQDAERAAQKEAAAEAERAEQVRRALADERAQIARELHDIVAHAMSVIAVRSGVARLMIDTDPQQAREALATIETTTRRSLREMRLLPGDDQRGHRRRSGAGARRLRAHGGDGTRHDGARRGEERRRSRRPGPPAPPRRRPDGHPDAGPRRHRGHRAIITDPDTAGARGLILTTFDLDDYVYRALRVGASGFLLKDTAPEELLVGIRTLASGDALLAPGITRRLIREFAARPEPEARPSHKLLESLSAREREVLAEVAGGWSNAEIGERLHISAATAKTHVSRLLMKLDANDRAQLVMIAYETRLVTPG